MANSRFAIALSMTLSTAAALILGLADARQESTSREAPIPGHAYAVQVTGNQALFDLELSPTTRYALIVGSLGDASRIFEVTVDSEEVPQAERRPWSVIQPELSLPSSSPGRRLPWERDSLDRSSSAVDPGRKNRPSRNASPNPAPAEREFHLHVTDGQLDDARQYVRVASRLIAEGRSVRVYLDRQLKREDLAPGVTGEIVRLLDEELIPPMEAFLGSIRDVDGDGKLTILLSPWLGRLQGGKSSLGGFVRSTDFRTDLPVPFSNRCDMLYLNSNVPSGPSLKTLLAHELTHVICFSERLPSEAGRYGLPHEHDWLNEAIAHLAENLYAEGWSNLDHRINGYLNDPHEFPLVVDDYFHAGLWRNHGCRGATYLFLRWCVDQYGEEILPRLIRAPLRGPRNLEYVTGTRFEDLHRLWGIALLRSNRCALKEPLPPKSENAGQGSLDSEIERRTRTATARNGTESTSDRHGIAYRSLDVRGPLNRWILAGPRMIPCEPNDERTTMPVRGTAHLFIEITPSETAGFRRFRVQAEPGTKMQLTLVREPDGWPHPSVNLFWKQELSPIGERHALGTEGEASIVRNPSRNRSPQPVLQLLLGDDQSPNDLRIEAIGIETTESKPVPLWSRTLWSANEELLDDGQVSRMRGEDGETMRLYEFALPPSIVHRSEDCLLKIVCRDPQGRRAVIRKPLPSSDSSTETLLVHAVEGPLR